MEPTHIVYVQTIKPAEGVVVYAELKESAYLAQKNYSTEGLFKSVATQRYSRTYLETKYQDQAKLGAAMTKIRHLERKLFAAESVVQSFIAQSEGVAFDLRDSATEFLQEVAEYKNLYMSNRNKLVPQEYTYDLDENGSIPHNFMHTHVEWAQTAKTAYIQAQNHFRYLGLMDQRVVPFILQTKRYYVYTQKEFENEDEAKAHLLKWTEVLPRKNTVGCYVLRGGGYLFFLPENVRKLA